ncbi:MAG TPA: alpha/beta fold hydrolase [Actinomycetota bacterium]|nr:alpha/beta fold hydrolase [Actinomycetota bacterium]
MKARLLVLSVLTAAVLPASGVVAAPCVQSPRLPDNPLFDMQERRFGFHDEELIICSPGATSGVHIAARLWVPAGCPGIGGCPGVVIAHGFGFNKEVTFADMLQAVQRGLYVLSYDVRGQGMSGGQAAFLGRDDIADQAAVLDWWHNNVQPSKTAFYGLSQGGWLSWTAAVYNCGAARAAVFDSTIPCDEGGRWVDAIAPVQGPTEYLDDGTCPLFGVEALAYSRFNPTLVGGLAGCIVNGRPGQTGEVFVDIAHRLTRIDVPVYAITSFYDRLILPQLVTSAYEELAALATQPGSAIYGKDVRLLISNDGHGAVGGNFAVVGDIFSWIASQIGDGAPLRDAKVSIAQEWEGNAFRLEHAWPIPDTETRTLYLARDGAGSLAAAPAGTPDQLRNLPYPASPPEAPFVGTLVGFNNDLEVPDARLVYTTEPLAETLEFTGGPAATIYVSGTTGGEGQLHVGLAELEPNGSAHEFAHARIGLTDLGPDPVAVTLPLTIASHRIDAGNRLMVVVTSADALVTFPARGLDPFYVHHDGAAPSSITVPVVPVDRVPPAGDPPSGAGFTEDPLGAICQALSLPC